MAEVNIELCPETGICSLMKSNTSKADLMPFEVEKIRSSVGDATKIRKIVAEADNIFANSLSDEELIALANNI